MTPKGDVFVNVKTPIWDTYKDIVTKYDERGAEGCCIIDLFCINSKISFIYLYETIFGVSYERETETKSFDLITLWNSHLLCVYRFATDGNCYEHCEWQGTSDLFSRDG